MGSFYSVSSGATTQAGDVNQFSGVLNGSVGGQITLLSTASNLAPLLASLPAAPTGSDQSVMQLQVAGDAFARVSAYIRSSDGYGGVRAGAGVGAPTAHLYAQSNGWRTDESLAVGGALNVTGTTTLAGVNAQTLTLSGGLTTGAASTFGGTIYASAGLVVHPLSGDDALQFWDGAGVQTGVMGYRAGGGGLYFYDNSHGGYIWLNATPSGISFNGTVTAPTFGGAIAIDVESSQTVMRTGVGAINIVIQVNGHNWVFRNDGKLITPSGQTIS